MFVIRIIRAEDFPRVDELITYVSRNTLLIERNGFVKKFEFYILMLLFVRISAGYIHPKNSSVQVSFDLKIGFLHIFLLPVFIIPKILQALVSSSNFYSFCVISKQWPYWLDDKSCFKSPHPSTFPISNCSSFWSKINTTQSNTVMNSTSKSLHFRRGFLT